MFNFLKIQRKTRTLAVVLIHETSLGKEFLSPRLDVLTTQAREAGLEVVCAPIGKFDVSKYVSPDRRAFSLQELNKYAAARNVVFLIDNQYHVSSWWISELMEKTNKTAKSYCLNGMNTAYLVSHFSLAAQFYSIYAPHVGRFIDHLESGQYYYWHPPRDMFKYLDIPVEVVEITAQNVNTLYKQAITLDLPLTFVVETNSSCNYVCLMCPYHGGRQRHLPAFVKPGTYIDMPLDTFKRVINEVASLKRQYQDNPIVTINPYRRGEPLLYPEWREAVRYIKSKGLRVYFSTNGSSWSDEDIDFALDVGLDQIQISIEGHDFETHRLLRLNNEFVIVVNTLRRIIRRREERGLNIPFVQLSHTINERNIHEVDTYINEWLDKSDALFLGPENYNDIADYNKKYKMDFAPVQPKPDSFRPPCGMIKDTIYIDANGDCMLCLGSKMTTLGNINNMSVQELLDSKLRKDIIQEHIIGNFDNPICKNCQVWYGAYVENIETQNYSLRISPDTQYYTRKNPINISW